MKTCPEVYSAPETMAVPTRQNLSIRPTLVVIHFSALQELTAHRLALPSGVARLGAGNWQPPSCTWWKTLEGLGDNVTGMSWDNGLHSPVGNKLRKKGQQSEPPMPGSAPTPCQIPFQSEIVNGTLWS